MLILQKGMLASPETVRVVAKALRDHHIALTVVDPVWAFPNYRDNCSDFTGNGIYKRLSIVASRGRQRVTGASSPTDYHSHTKCPGSTSSPF